MEKNDQQLVVDYLGGDDNALPILINRQLKTIYNFIYRLVGKKEDVEDIAQRHFSKCGDI